MDFSFDPIDDFPDIETDLLAGLDTHCSTTGIYAQVRFLVISLIIVIFWNLVGIDFSSVLVMN